MPMLAILDDVSAYRGGRPVAKQVNLQIEAGEVILLIGHNGSGKSSLLLAIADLLERTGSVTLRNPASALTTAFLPQVDDVFPGRSGLSNIAAGALGRLRPTASECAALRRDLAVGFPELEAYLEHPAGQLSGGQRRLIALARTMLMDASLFLLDEPTIGLETSLAARVLSDFGRSVQETARSILIVEHNLAVAGPLATRLCVMREGELVYDGSPDLLASPEKLTALYL